MAEEETKKEEAAPVKSKKKLFIIIGGVVGLLLFIGIPATFFLLKSGEDKVEEAPTDLLSSQNFSKENNFSEEDLEEGEEPLGALFPLDTFVVNLSGTGFIRLQAQFELKDREIPNRIYSRVVPIRDEIISALSKKTQSELLTSRGQSDLKNEITEIANKQLKQNLIKQVFFTQFVIQGNSEGK